MATFHGRLNRLKNVSGKTQVQIAEELGITPQNLSYYFNGREPSYDLLIKMANLFNVTTDYLLGKSDFVDFNSELQYKNLQVNDSKIQDIRIKTDIIKDINNNLSKVINDIIYIHDDRVSESALDALERCLSMILYCKETLRESFGDMEKYINLLKIMKESHSGLPNLRDILFSQRQIAACREYLNEFLLHYIYCIFDFKQMKLKEDCNTNDLKNNNYFFKESES